MTWQIRVYPDKPPPGVASVEQPVGVRVPSMDTPDTTTDAHGVDDEGPKGYMLITAQILDASLFLMRDLTNAMSAALVLAFNARAWYLAGPADSSIRLDLHSLRGMRTEPNHDALLAVAAAEKHNAAQRARSGSGSGNTAGAGAGAGVRGAKSGMGVTGASTGADGLGDTGSSSLGNTGGTGGGYESDIGDVADVSSLAYSESGRPAHLRVREVRASDYLQPLDLTLALIMRGDPSFMLVRLATAHTLQLRLGVNDYELVNDAVASATSAKEVQEAHASGSPNDDTQEGGNGNNGNSSATGGGGSGDCESKQTAPGNADSSTDAGGAQTSGNDDGAAAAAAMAGAKTAASAGAHDTASGVGIGAGYQGDGSVLPVSLSIQAALPDVEVVVVNDFAGLDLPLAALHISSVQVAANGWGANWEQMSASARTTLHAEYYNMQRSIWEPLLEPWTIHIDYQAPEVRGQAARDRVALVPVHIRNRQRQRGAAVAAEGVPGTALARVGPATRTGDESATGVIPMGSGISVARGRGNGSGSGGGGHDDDADGFDDSDEMVRLFFKFGAKDELLEGDLDKGGRRSSARVLPRPDPNDPDHPPATLIRVRASQVLNLNVSEAFVNGLLDSLNILSTLKAKEEAKQSTSLRRDENWRTGVMYVWP